jgi:hypothetical protein
MRGARIPLAPLDEASASRRTWDQRLYLRLPALYRAITSAVMALRPGSRLRCLMLARSMPLAYAAANRQDFDVVVLGFDGGFRYRPSRDLTPPDMPSVFHGEEGYRRLWTYWLDAFGDIRWDPEAILDFGDTLLVTTRQRGHGSGSGVGVSVPVFQLFRMRRGLVVSQEDFLNRDEALEAVADQGGSP